MKTKFALAAILAAVAMSASAASSTYDFSFTAGDATGSGTFLVDSTGLITGATGTFNDSNASGTILGVIPVGNAAASADFIYDNLFLSGGDHFTNGGLVVDVNGTNVNFYDNGGSFAVVDYLAGYGGGSGYIVHQGGENASFTATLAVDEPASIGLWLAALIAMGVLYTRRSPSNKTAFTGLAA